MIIDMSLLKRADTAAAEKCMEDETVRRYFAQLIGFGYGLGAAALIVLAVWAIKRWRNQKPKPVAGPVKETGE
ncbi:uncharacterized protein MKK02DRAFT_41887 [Dioszegia hungarica]|uniref:Uncharacterized protein n=1 Tax=Dioszegia hungarica TaxID=4972 RepID=A0AA38HDQ7_9TREE|nr:uncharacterized protein MKK02DRAFT_41887 [Dioszegia hungarica]KAI9638860.1 hypothetical protein MKK02DRAFT_41887 [Dioszegia hungarica]